MTINKNKTPMLIVIRKEGLNKHHGGYIDCPFCLSKDRLKIRSGVFKTEAKSKWGTDDKVGDTFCCVNCGENGDIFDLIGKVKNLDFEDTVHYLSRKYNVFNELEKDEDIPEEVWYHISRWE